MNPLDVLGLGRELVVRCSDNPEYLMKVAEELRKTQATLFHPDVFSGGEEVMKAINAALSDLRAAYKEDGLQSCIASYLGRTEFFLPIFSEYCPTSEQEHIKEIERLEQELAALKVGSAELTKRMLHVLRGDITGNPNHLLSFSGVVVTDCCRGKNDVSSLLLYLEGGRVIQKLCVRHEKRESERHTLDVEEAAHRLYEKPTAAFRTRAITRVEEAFLPLGAVEVRTRSRMMGDRQRLPSGQLFKVRMDERSAVRIMRTKLVPEIRERHYFIGADGPFMTVGRSNPVVYNFVLTKTVIKTVMAK